MKNSGTRTTGILTFALAAVLAALVFIHIDVNINHYNAQMDADIASEALLSEVIYENGLHTPDTWIRSTEARIIHAPNLAALLYPFTGQNMNLSMGIACCLMMLGLVAAMAVYMKVVGFKWQEALIALILLFSLSDIRTENQSILFLWAAYYATHFITLFLSLIFYHLGLVKKTVSIPIWIISALIAVVNGMQGLHTCLFCYFPILGAEILRQLINLIRNKKCAAIPVTIWAFAAALISYISDKVANPYDLGASRNIRHAPEKFVNEVWPALKGVVSFKISPVVVGVVCVIAAAGYFAVMKAALDSLYKRVSGSPENKAASGQNYECKTTEAHLLWSLITPILSLIICTLSLTFTTVEVAPRYFITELFIIGLGGACFVRFGRKNLMLPTAFLVLIVGILSSNYYRDALVVNDNFAETSEYMAAQWMQENGYDYGYATFDFANSITVYSNNKIKVRAVDSMGTLKGCKWLTDSTWYPPTKESAGETCYITTAYSDEEFCSYLDKNDIAPLQKEKVGSFNVYVLDHDYTTWE